MIHKARQHRGTDEGEIEPHSVTGQNGHEVTEIPYHICDADEEIDQIDDGARSPDQDECGKDEIDQHNGQSHIGVDRNPKWRHLVNRVRVRFMSSLWKRAEKVNTLFQVSTFPDGFHRVRRYNGQRDHLDRLHCKRVRLLPRVPDRPGLYIDPGKLPEEQ